jgi:Na+:H+ antiporter, NhaA family
LFWERQPFFNAETAEIAEKFREISALAALSAVNQISNTQKGDPLNMKHVSTADRPSRQPPIEQLLLPFQNFVKAEASSGILLILCTVIALVWANSPWAGIYTGLWQNKLTVGLGSFTLSKSLLLWINDGLMTVFFFVVGLEIKREILVGELASTRQAMLPITAALGGMIFPALLFVGFNAGQPSAPGWGIPMATDIAFALGILSLLGKRVPLSLKVFLTAVAIVDDIGAVLVIAVFYTAEIAWLNLVIGTGFLAVLIIANRVGVRQPLIYALLGIGLWLAFLKSGVHTTVAGVLLAMTIPSRTRINANEFLVRGRFFLDEFERSGAAGKSILTNKEQRAAVQALETACQQVEAPLQRLEHTLHPWVAYAIMPLFALANAGVSLGGNLAGALAEPAALGIIAGLVVGKQVGITLAVWLLAKSRIGARPTGVTWRHIYGASWLAGIGFTMSLFIASLAFGDTPLLATAKVGILAASLIAAVIGWLILRGAQPEAEN